MLEVVAKLKVRLFLELIWSLVRSFFVGNIRMLILPTKKERKIRSKELSKSTEPEFCNYLVKLIIIFLEF